MLYASKRKHEVVVKLLLASGHVDPDSKDNYGRTPLLYTVKEGHEVVAGVFNGAYNNENVRFNVQDGHLNSEISDDGL